MVEVPQALAREILKLPVVNAGEGIDPILKLSMDMIHANDANARTLLERGAKPVVPKQKIANQIEQIGVHRNAAGQKDRPGTEGARYNKAKGAQALNERYLEVGYDSLNAGEKQALRDKVIAKLKSRPGFAAELTNPVLLNAKAEEILRNPAVANLTNQELIDFANDPKHKISDDYDKAQENLAEKQRIKDEVDRQHKRAKDKLNKVETSLDDYSDNKKNTAGTKANKKQQYEANEAGNKAKVEAKKREIEKLDDRIDRLTKDRDATVYSRDHHETVDRYGKALPPDNRDYQKEIKEIETQIQAAEGELSQATAEQTTAQHELDQLKDLRDEEADLKTKQEKLKEAVEDWEAKQKVAQDDVTFRQQLLDDQVRAREVDEGDIGTDLDLAVDKAVDKWLDQEVVQKQQALDDLKDQATAACEEKAKKETDENLKKELEQRAKDEEDVHNRLRGIFVKITPRKYEKTWWGGRKLIPTKIDINEEQIDAYYTGLLQNKTNEIVQRVLGVPVGPALTADQQRMQPIIIRDVLRFRRMYLGKIPTAEVTAITEAPWYKGLVNDGIKYNPQFAERMQELLGPTVDMTQPQNEQALVNAAKQELKSKGLEYLLLLLMITPEMIKTVQPQQPNQQTP